MDMDIVFRGPVYMDMDIVFRGCVYMSGRVTLGVGLSYQLGRVTLLGGPAFCLLKSCKRSRQGDPRGRAISNCIK